MMCVSTGPRICLVCLLLYSWHARAEEPDIGGIPQQYDDIHTKPDIPAEVDDDTNELYFMEKDYFLTKLMNKYGNGVEMTYEGFEHLLYHLGLGGVLKFDHSISCHKVENSSEFLQIHLHHNHSADANQSSKICLHEEEHSHEHTHVLSHDHSHDDHDHTHNEQEHIHGDHEHDVKDKGVEHEGEEDHDHEGHSHEHGDHDHEHDNLEHNIVEHEHDEKENSTVGAHNQSDIDESHEHNDDNHEHDHLDHNHNHKEIEDETHVHNQTVDQSIHTDGNIHDGHDHDDGGEHDHAHDGEHGHDHGGEHDHDHGGEHDHDGDHDHAHGGEHGHDHGEHDHNHGEHDHDHGDADHEHHRKKRHSGYDECLSAKVMLRLVLNDDQPRSLTKEMFKELCPSLIYQIDADTCHSSHSNDAHGNHDRFHDHDGHDHGDHDDAEHAGSSAIDLSKVPPKVWGYSTIAVVIISLVGLLGVAVIPIMQKVFYNHMLQFLVAMAVGALSGDALLHLFPHAIAGGHGDEHGGHSHGEEGHYHDPAPIYKGLLGLFGIYFFFFTERALTMFTEYKRKKKQKKNRNKYMKDEEMVKVGEKLANSECDGMMMSIHPNKALKGYADEAHTEHCTISFENTTRISHQHGQRQNCTEETCVDGDENTSMIGSVNSTPKSHGHGHGHSHGVDGVPESVASVAWMVILGDGIHNFSDGLAIGAAFVNSITGGFSTSIAVFCHELPHEIGDFAMLLRAGMSPKQAIIYNCLSSILCFIGMLIGVAIGNLEGASLWIFSIVGGMFLYIALVDMLPELSAVETKKGEHPLCHLLLQGIGMCLGAGIMLAIALYEGDLKTLLD